jgi:hypothetical protein
MKRLSESGPDLVLLSQVCEAHNKTILCAVPCLSKVSAEILERFGFALQKEAIEVTKANFKELPALRDAFSFERNNASHQPAQSHSMNAKWALPKGSFAEGIVSALIEVMSEGFFFCRRSLFSVIQRVQVLP